MEEIFSSIPRDGAKRIGHPVWQAITDIRNAAGKIQQPVKFIWSRLRKGSGG